MLKHSREWRKSLWLSAGIRQQPASRQLVNADNLMLRDSNMYEYTHPETYLAAVWMSEACEDPELLMMNGNSRVCDTLWKWPRWKALWETELFKVQTTPVRTWQNYPHLPIFWAKTAIYSNLNSEGYIPKPSSSHGCLWNCPHLALKLCQDLNN